MNKSLLLVILTNFLGFSYVGAQIQLPRLLSNGAVLQRDKPLELKGKASAGEAIQVSLDRKTYRTTADQNGNWQVKIPAHKAGGPFEMVLKGKNEIRVNDLLFGDVWLCAGQSNMVNPMERVKEKYGDDIAAASFPQIRNFTVKTATNLNGSQKDFKEGEWVEVTPEKVMTMGSVSFFFARELYKNQNVPIGIINTSVGGTPIQAWISEQGLQGFPEKQKIIQQNKQESYVAGRLAQNAQNMTPTPQNDQGMLETPKWYQPDYTPKGWLPFFIPGFWEDQGLHNLNGVVWFRREITVPENMCGVDAKLFMGRIVDADHLYVNGNLVGNITYQYPPRRYTVKAGILKPGKNLIVIRVQNSAGKGGFVPDKPYYLTANGHDLDLKGEWSYKVGQTYEPLAPPKAPPFSAQNQPAALFNAMVAPVTTATKLKGIVWYQGESDTDQPQAYGEYLKALIADYRRLWQQPELPFLYVQLANFMERDLLPSESNWAELREQQRKTMAVSNTAMAVAIDLGEWNDIHPLNKEDVGLRLSEAAKALAYNQKRKYSGPAFKSMQLQGNKLILSFDHVGSGLVSQDGEPLAQFAVADDDKKFVWAKAQIENNQVVVWADQIAHPKYVRYAWANNPFGANLYNKEGFPASPFEAHLPQVDQLWHGKKGAVVLTYDDALEVHLDNVIPVLDSLGLKGSFYLSAAFPGAKNRIEDWKKAARKGHELGNHTLYHPCDASKQGRSWVLPGNDLHKYTTASIEREVAMTNTFLESLDGRKERTFAYTCGDTETGEGSFIQAIKPMFVAMRGVEGKMNTVSDFPVQNLYCYPVDDSNVDQLYALAEKAKAENAMLVLLFHGVGGGHNINVNLQKHTAFLKFLKDHSEEYWVPTLLDAVKHVQQMGKK